MIGTKIFKNDFKQNVFDDCVYFCNEYQNATMEDKGDYYECVAIPAPALDDVKSAKIAELKFARDAEELSPIEYRGYMWDFDDKAQQRINGAIVALSGGGSVTWTSADNQEIANVNAQDLRGVVGAAALRSNVVHVKYRQLRERVEACETAEDVANIIWE